MLKGKLARCLLMNKLSSSSLSSSNPIQNAGTTISANKMPSQTDDQFSHLGCVKKNISYELPHSYLFLAR